MHRITRFALAALILVAPLSNVRAEDGTFDSGGVKIHYTVQGQGEPVLLIHGYTANAAINWNGPGVTKMLAEKYKVITIDNRGHGLSDKPEDPDQYGVKMVDDSIRLLDHLKIDKAHIVGYSMGGMITLKMAVLHPERMRSAILGGMGWTKPRIGEIARARGAAIEERAKNKAFAACALRFYEFGITEAELKAIKVPMSLIVGGNDPLKNSSVEPLKAARPDVPMTVVEGATHISCIAKPEFKEAISKYLAAQAGHGTAK